MRVKTARVQPVRARARAPGRAARASSAVDECRARTRRSRLSCATGSRRRRRAELLAFRSLIEDYEHADVLRVVLARAARSARRTTHFDLDFPREPQRDAVLVPQAPARVPAGRARRALPPPLHARHAGADQGVRARARRAGARRRSCTATRASSSSGGRFDGVVTSPPYPGLIDYHEQHRYAYELLGLDDRRELELGAAGAGTSGRRSPRTRRGSRRCSRTCAERCGRGAPVLIVVNDRRDLYPEILERAGLRLEERFRRHVNRRTGRRAGEFFEDVLVARGLRAPLSAQSRHRHARAFVPSVDACSHARSRTRSSASTPAGSRSRRTSQLGVPGFAIVGLADRACQEAKERVRSGIAVGRARVAACAGSPSTSRRRSCARRARASTCRSRSPCSAASRQVPPERARAATRRSASSRSTGGCGRSAACSPPPRARARPGSSGCSAPPSRRRRRRSPASSRCRSATSPRRSRTCAASGEPPPYEPPPDGDRRRPAVPRPRRRARPGARAPRARDRRRRRAQPAARRAARARARRCSRGGCPGSCRRSTATRRSR